MNKRVANTPKHPKLKKRKKWGEEESKGLDDPMSNHPHSLGWVVQKL
jgi:hypothetical protein